MEKEFKCNDCEHLRSSIHMVLDKDNILYNYSCKAKEDIPFNNTCNSFKKKIEKKGCK